MSFSEDGCTKCQKPDALKLQDCSMPKMSVVGWSPSDLIRSHPTITPGQQLCSALELVVRMKLVHVAALQTEPPQLPVEHWMASVVQALF